MAGSARSLRFHTLADFFGRYAAVLGQAWRERHQTDMGQRLPYEAQFLPAALALQETPVSPAPRVTMWVLMLFALIVVIWATLGQIDMVATAPGKIVPGDRSKVIQSIETATIKTIRVADGQTVNAGDILMELDATSAIADLARIESDLAAAKLQAARARALLAAIETGKRPYLPNITDIGKSRHSQEQRLLLGQFEEFRAKLARIDADTSRREAELSSTRQIVAKLQLTVPIARRRADDFRGLVDKKFVSEHGYLEKEQLRIEQEGDLATQLSRLDELSAGVHEGRQQRLALVAETRRIALDSLSEGEQKAAALAQEKIKAESHGRLLTLTAPVTGTVQQLAVHTVGGVATAAQPLMVVVPREDALEVEAFLDNKDIGFVVADQDAVVKIETFPYTKYGTLPATVVHVSSDAIQDEKKGLLYSVRVRLGRTAIRVDEKIVELSPGMAVSVEIRTGQRRVIEYFLSPLLQHKDESLRER